MLEWHGFVARVALCGLLALAPSVRAAPHTLPAGVETALARAGLPREALVAVVEEVGAHRPRLAWQPALSVNPASLMKLLTTDAALELLGPAWTWSTPVWLQGSVRDPGPQGVLDGDLVIKGSGDPQLVLERVWLLLRRVQQSGVNEIHGDIVLDRSAFADAQGDPAAFDGEPWRPHNVQPDALLLNFRSLLLGFAPDSQRGVATVRLEPPLADVQADASVPLSGAPCAGWRDALAADLGSIRLHFAGSYPASCGEQQWPVAYADPAHYDARLLRGLWQRMGGRLTGGVREGTAPPLPPSFFVDSPPLAVVVRDMNKFSNNLMAQQLFLTLALVDSGTGTPQAARVLLQRWAGSRLGKLASDLVVDNGSGLSRDGRLSARLLAQLLQNAWASPVMPEFMASLPISGVDGTMRRAQGSPGRAHLKSGSLRDVSGIAGYVLSRSGRRYVVVGIVNHPNAEASRPVLDALVDWVAADEPPEPRRGD
jgi:D-alanyl-D-alanine carboxypeptidase/D-alanyl-D-alanine-endopeptidase (penicillin-binding protein 4)